MTFRIRFPHHHIKTKYIELIRSNCRACWACVEACPQHVLGKAVLFKHRHAHVDHAEACKGCKKCVRVCPHDAIRYTYIAPSRQDRRAAQPRL